MEETQTNYIWCDYFVPFSQHPVSEHYQALIRFYLKCKQRQTIVFTKRKRESSIKSIISTLCYANPTKQKREIEKLFFIQTVMIHMEETMSLSRNKIMCIHKLIFQYLNACPINTMCYSTKKNHSAQMTFSIKCIKFSKRRKQVSDF